MAKVKTEKVVDENAVETAAPVAETTQEPTNEPKVEVEVPENVKNVLKLYPNIKEMYVDDKGGVYTKPVPEHLIKDVPLYQNPYFKQ